MSSSPFRCSHKRIHRDTTNIGDHNNCEVPPIVIWTPDPPRTGSSNRQANDQSPKRGRGRPRKQTLITPPDDQADFSDNQDIPSSPLESRSTAFLRPFGSLFTPQASQEESALPAEDETSDMESSIAPHSEVLQHTPGGTSFVPDTPFGDTAVVQGHDPGPESFVREDTTPELSQAVTTSNVDNTREYDFLQQKLEEQQLRRSRARCIEELEDSTALVNRLQTRRQILEAQTKETNAMLARTKLDGEANKEDAEHTKQQLGGLLVLLIGLIVAYVLWGWYKAPDMEYIRQRREAVLTE